MRFVIITGMSGAGKTQVMHNLEDMGYYCIDNMPVVFLIPFAKMCYADPKTFENIAIVADIRGGEYLKDIGKSLDELRKLNFKYEILFLEAQEDIIIKRYKETRRKHPLSPDGTISEGIALERKSLSYLRECATSIVDTSHLLTRELKEIIKEKYGTEKNSYFSIQVVSFGYKYGIPRDADLVFDVRFLPNPFYIPELKQYNGTQAPVHDYVMGFKESTEFLNKLTDMLSMLIPSYIKEGKTELVIAIGCTGGKHRSVTIAQELYGAIKKLEFKTIIRHRDMAEGENL